jgi:hypothetical protein
MQNVNLNEFYLNLSTNQTLASNQRIKHYCRAALPCRFTSKGSKCCTIKLTGKGEFLPLVSSGQFQVTKHHYNAVMNNFS